MPATSRRQFRKMFVLYQQGKLTKRQLDDFTKGVPYSSLPERVKSKKRKRK